MRKSFTRFLNVIMALVLSLGAYTAFGQTYVPADGSSNIKKTDEVSVTFSADVSKGTGYVRFYEATGDVPLFVELVSDSRIVVSGKKVVFNFNSMMVDSKQYYVTWDNGAFKLGNNNVAALTKDLTSNTVGWDWTTGDYTGPVVDVKTDGTHLSPKKGATNVLTTTTTLSILFKENVQPTTGTEKVYLMKDNGGTYGDVVAILDKTALNVASGTPKQVDITVSGLQQNTTYYVLMDNGAVRDASVNANKFAGITDKTFWTFSTKDTSAPVMTIAEKEVTKSKVSYDVAFSEKGKLYYIVVAGGETDVPTNAQVKAGVSYTGATVLASGTATYTDASSKVIEVTTLTNATQGGTEFDFYFVSETYINVSGVSETLGATSMKAVKMVDNVKPTLQTKTPTGTDVAKDAKLVMTFDEVVKLGTGNVTVKKTTDNTVFATFDIAGATLSTDKKTVTIDLPVNFASLTQYYVLVPSTVILDAKDNAYAGIGNTTTWTFTCEDYAAPTFTSAPANGASNVAVPAAGIVLTFNEQIKHRDGSAIADDADLAAHGLNQAFILKENGVEKAINYEVTGTPNIITVTLETGSFAADKEYSLTFLGWYVSDYDGNIIQNSSEIVFNTVDNIKPTVASVKPDHLKAADNILLNFSEPVRLTNDTELNDTNVDGVIVSFNEKVSGVSLGFDATVSGDKKQIIINPTVDLQSEKTYQITLTSGLEDYANNALDGDVNSVSTLVYEITVDDLIKPVATLTPANGASVAAGTLAGKVVFSEAVTKLIGGGNPDASIVTLREGSETGVVIPITVTGYASNILDFTATVVAGKTYYLAVGASVTDGDNVNDAVTSVFTTLSNAAPTIATTGSPAKKVVTPLEDATAVATDAAITVTFADPISAIVNESFIVLTDDVAATNDVAAVTGSSLSADGKTLTITHGALPANTKVYVTLKVGAVQSQTATAQAGNLGWSFTTVDTVAPTGPTLSPTGTGVAIASTGTGKTVLQLVFADTENLHLGTGTVKIRKASNDEIVQELGVAQMTVKSTGGSSSTKETVEIALNGDLAYATAYYVQVASTLILDVENNAYAGISLTSGWTFTTEDAPAFIVNIAGCDPTAYQDSVLETAPLKVKFNHNVQSKNNAKEITLDEVTFVAGTAPASLVAANNVFALPPNDPAFTWAGNELTIDYVVDLQPNKAYRLKLDAGVATDVYSGALTADATGATSTDTYIVFFTSGKQGPVASFSPADDEEGVAKDANVVVTFDEPFFKNTSGAMYTALELQTLGVDATPANRAIWVSATTTASPIAFTANIDGNAITLDLGTDLASLEDVTVHVNAGKFFDADDNFYDKEMDGTGDEQSATFTVLDFVAPAASISATFPSEITGTGFKYKVQSTEKGSVYSLVTLATATATKADVMAGTTTAIADVNTAKPSTAIAVTGLTPSTNYKLWFFGVDETGNEQALQSTTVTTIDDVKPLLVKVSPENGAATTANIVLEFNENLTTALTAAKTVYLKDKATGTIIESWTSASATGVDFATAKKVIIDPTTLLSSKTYVVEVDKGIIKDAAGNAYDSFITFEFTVADETAPTVKFTKPNNAASTPQYNVTDGNGIEITFSEAVTAKTEKVKVYEDSGNGTFLESEETLVQLIDPASMTASADNKVRTFNITAPLTQGKVYWVVVATTCFEDLAGNALAAQVEGKLNVVDTSAPVPAHTYSPTVPATADVDVAIDNNILINFNEKIYWTVHHVDNYLHDLNVDSLITLTGPNGAVPFDATINAGNTQITIDPTNSLKSLSTYVVTVSQVEDGQKNLMDTYSFTFTTGEYNPPVAMFDPAHDTEDASAVGPFTITFDKNVYVYVNLGSLPVLAPLTNENVEDYFTLAAGGSITGTLEDFTATVTDGKVVTIVPDEALADSGADDYTYGLKNGVSIFDALGNALTGSTAADAADSTYATITIQDLTAPTVVNKSTPVEVDDAMWIKFSEDVAVGTGSLFIRRVEDGQLIETITTDALTVNEDTLFIAHADFPLNTNFYVVIDEGFATDLSGNKFEGIADDQVIYHPTNAPDAWNFNTNDTMYPMVIDQSPAPGDVDVLVGQSLTITFNKAVQAGTGFIAIYEADGTPHQIIDVTSASVVFNQYAADTVVTILHTAFKAETGYFVRIDKGAIEDMANNDFAGIADESWNFTTEDITAPDLELLTPEDNSTEVSVVSTFEMSFDRNVAKGAGNIKIFDRTGATLIETLPISSENVVITDNVVSFNFVDALEYDSEYYIIVEAGAITNASVNAIPFAGITTALAWSFTTGGDMEAPVLTAYTPNMETIADNHPTLTMTFDEAVMLSEMGGQVMITEKDSTEATVVIDLAAAMISEDGMTVTVTYDAAVSGGLNKDTEYFVTVDADALEDMAGNAFAGVTDMTTWTFTTGSDFATNVQVNGSLEFKVYPNPFNDYLKVDNGEKLSRIVITNVAGQRIKDIVSPTSIVRTGDLRSGIYFMTLVKDNAVVKTERIVKR